MNGSPTGAVPNPAWRKEMPLYYDDLEDLLTDATEEFESFLSLRELDFDEPTYSPDFEIAEYGEEHA